MRHNRWLVLGATIAVALLGSLTLWRGALFAQGGTGPADALLPTGAPMTVPPDSQTWFKFEESGHSQLVKIALDANHQTGILFRVYTPDSIGQWISQNGLHAVGVSGASPGHDQVWLGRFQLTGTYYAVVENSNPYPVVYRLTVQGEGVTTLVNRAPTPTPLPNPYTVRVPVGALTGGGKIVFQESSGGNIYTVNADGANLQRVTFGLDPAFSPDGSRIAFVRQGPVPGLYVSNADGSNERNLFGGTQVRSPTWASNHEIVYSSVTGEKTGAAICFLGRCFGGGSVTRWTLFVYDLDDGSSRNVIVPPTGGTVPSVNRVLGEIAFMNPEKGLLRTTLATDAEPKLLNSDLSINSPVMSPDGARVTYMVSQPPSWQVVIAVWDGTNPTLLTTANPLSFAQSDNVSPTFSPNGQEILFLSNLNGKWEFYAMNIDGTNQRQVLKGVTDSLNIQYNYSAERVASWVK